MEKGIKFAKRYMSLPNICENILQRTSYNYE